MARALITGIAGFTGRHLQHELERAGHEVFGLTHAGGAASDRVVACDLLDAAGLRAAIERVQPDWVAHLAAVAFVGHGDVDAIYRTNVVGTRNLLAALAAQQRKPQAVLLASSANIYGNATAGVIDESVPPAPANDYAVSKLAMEHMARLWTAQLPITFVRPFNYTGVGQTTDFLLPKIVDHLRRRAPVIELGNLDVERDFSDVRMVVSAYRRLLDRQAGLQAGGEVFNVCSGRGYTLRQVLAMSSAIAGFAPQVQVNPKFVRANEVKMLVGNGGALEQAIGPLAHIDLTDTLRWMIQS
ncbi:NAD-dependent epimerase/dehydratase family protein [Piscinibacter terrae]|uniref:NAD-dependent epimerase/dehydratase family protein n=1 Tax=Piscinibacter terrae TaxID=2496871 RepID=A0A3N7HVD9_9BURK|nr:NAD-dependent epimerase/dehydratase family protein [Albitalea terrae]RQP26330.1 NAD-dependent epimerase/dehydratase family protein [Albitalea terrae]